jgi:F420-0:gamma-glutamyl ligase-like protein
MSRNILLEHLEPLLQPADVAAIAKVEIGGTYVFLLDRNRISTAEVESLGEILRGFGVIVVMCLVDDMDAIQILRVEVQQ